MSTTLDFSFFLDALAERVADKLAAREAPPERVLVSDANAHGVPGDAARWLRDRQRRGLITIRGPRSARYVLKSDLDALLDSTVRRRPSSKPRGAASIEDDARDAVAELAAKRGAA